MTESGSREIQFESSVAGLAPRVAERVLAGRAGTQKPADGGSKDVRRRLRAGGDKVVSFGLRA